MAKRNLAVFTIAQEEPETLPKWLAHYSKHVAAHDLYVLHHALAPGGEPWLDDAVAAYPRVRVVAVDADRSFDHAWIGETVARFQHFLLQSYRWTLFSDADELVAPVPAEGEAECPSLSRHVETLEGGATQAFRCDGFEVIQAAGEAALDLDRPWLPQRSWWARNRYYAKPLLARSPVRWTDGFHDLAEDCRRDALPCRLALVHLKKVDIDLALRRHRRYASRDWSPGDLVSGAGCHQRIVEDGPLRRYFDTADDGQVVVLSPISDWARSLA